MQEFNGSLSHHSLGGVGPSHAHWEEKYGIQEFISIPIVTIVAHQQHQSYANPACTFSCNKKDFL